jgi:hypothetical protein
LTEPSVVSSMTITVTPTNVTCFGNCHSQFHDDSWY